MDLETQVLVLQVVTVIAIGVACIMYYGYRGYYGLYQKQRVATSAQKDVTIEYHAIHAQETANYEEHIKSLNDLLQEEKATSAQLRRSAERLASKVESLFDSLSGQDAGIDAVLNAAGTEAYARDGHDYLHKEPEVPHTAPSKPHEKRNSRSRRVDTTKTPVRPAVSPQPTRHDNVVTLRAVDEPTCHRQSTSNDRSPEPTYTSSDTSSSDSSGGGSGD